MTDEKKSSKTRPELLEDLAKATKQMAVERSLKKADAAAHSDAIDGIQEKIDDIVAQLENA